MGKLYIKIIVEGNEEKAFLILSIKLGKITNLYLMSKMQKGMAV